jgi:hypothetical protein
MIKEVTARCDRCGRTVDGLHDEESGYTSGYYVLYGIWEKFAREGERIICDGCMTEDPEYLKEHPGVTGEAERG